MITDKEIEELADEFRKTAKNYHYNWKREQEVYVAGFKVAQSKLYSEEEVLILLKEIVYKYHNFQHSEYKFSTEDWFEQNKKK
jgi:hypothetical protein